MTFHGRCQCGAVAFEADGEIEEVMACNCSICKPKGYLLWFVPEASFRLTKTPEDLGGYRFASGNLHHRFCRTCGCSPFVEGPGTVAVNARCLPELDLASLKVQQYDGAHR